MAHTRDSTNHGEDKPRPHQRAPPITVETNSAHTPRNSLLQKSLLPPFVTEGGPLYRREAKMGVEIETITPGDG